MFTVFFIVIIAQRLYLIFLKLLFSSVFQWNFINWRLAWQLKIWSWRILQRFLPSLLIFLIDDPIFMLAILFFIGCFAILNFDWFFLSPVCWKTCLFKSCYIIQLTIVFYAQIWNRSQWFAVAKVWLSKFLFFWTVFKLKIWSPIEKASWFSKHWNSTVVLIGSHWLRDGLTAYTRTVIVIFVIISNHMHSDGPFISKSSKASISPGKMWRMSLLKFFNDFHLLLDFQLRFLEKY